MEAPVLGLAHNSGAQTAGPWGVNLDTISSISEVGEGRQVGRGRRAGLQTRAGAGCGS